MTKTEKAFQILENHPDLPVIVVVLLRKIVKRTLTEADVQLLDYIPDHVWQRYSIFGAIAGGHYDHRLPSLIGWLNSVATREFPELTEWLQNT